MCLGKIVKSISLFTGFQQDDRMKYAFVLAFSIALPVWIEAEHVVRKTNNGKVRGRVLRLLNSSVEEYAGIPYAEPPIGHLRFRPPVPRSSWEETYDATKPAVACPQVSWRERQITSEDCLHIHVWTPVPKFATRVPVLVMIHGGAFSYGSATDSMCNGTYIAAITGYVIVSLSYRIGILGFLNANSPEAPGNMGLLDQHLALRWVQENVVVFGGDPSVVTVIGVSAGAVSVNAHILSPMSKRLFRRAVMMSGSARTIDFFDTVHESMSKGNDVAKLLGCSETQKSLMSHPDDVIRCLRLKTSDELTLKTLEAASFKRFLFFPTFHDAFLPRAPSVSLERGFHADVDVMLGVTSDEGAVEVVFRPDSELLKENLQDIDEWSFRRSLNDLRDSIPKAAVANMVRYYESQAGTGERMALRRAYIDYISDRLFNCPAQFFAEKHSSRGNSVYFYVFGHKSLRDRTPKWTGARHGVDVPYVFASALANDVHFTAQDKTLSEDIVRMVAAFVRHGRVSVLYIRVLREK